MSGVKYRVVGVEGEELHPDEYLFDTPEEAEDRFYMLGWSMLSVIRTVFIEKIVIENEKIVRQEIHKILKTVGEENYISN